MPNAAKTRKPPEVKEIVKHLREQALEAKQREAARQIEAAGAELLGDYNFAYGREALLLAQVDPDALNAFTSHVMLIRSHLDEQFAEAALMLGEDDEQESS